MILWKNLDNKIENIDEYIANQLRDEIKLNGSINSYKKTGK